MEQTGEYRIEAQRDVVWAGLNDPEILARCIDGCLAMEKVDDDRFEATVKARIGPVSATFKAELLLQEAVPPERYTIAASVKGGAAGFARGNALVNLVPDGDATVLGYTVNANVGGKLAQVGSRLIDGAARKMADDFFSAFAREVGAPAPQPETPTAAAASTPPAVPTADGAAREARSFETGGRWKIWLIAFIALLLAMLFAL